MRRADANRPARRFDEIGEQAFNCSPLKEAALPAPFKKTDVTLFPTKPFAAQALPSRKISPPRTNVANKITQDNTS
jgi:hypothetical protein